MHVSRWYFGLAGVVLAFILAAGSVFGQSSGAQGANTGDGPTPFTGLARAPEANFFTGSALTEIPIQLPPGRAGIAPKLALKYSSHNGPSPYGYGWALPLGHIQRSTKRSGAILCGAEPPDFVAELPDGQVECVLQGSRCWPGVEDSFLRIEYNAAANSWQVRDRSGRLYVFGSSFAAREPASPLPGCKTFRWYLTRVEDANGNYLTVEYDTNARQDTSYPVAIHYTGNSVQELPLPFSVRFVWRRDQFSCPDGSRSGRPCDDRIIEATGGYPRELDRLLDRIEVWYFSSLARQYGFEYEFDLGDPERVGRRSFLSAVTLYDGSGRALSRLDGQPASTTFLYRTTKGQEGFAGIQDAQRPTFPSHYLRPDLPDALRVEVSYRESRATYREVADMNGDGFADLVDLNDNCMHWDPVTGYELLDATWDVHPGSLSGFAPTPIRWDIRTLADARLNGDHCPAFRRSRSAGTASWTENETLDITGDGVPDHVSSHLWTATYPYWVVFPGIRPSSPQERWRFGAPQLWRAPHREIRRSEAGVHFLGHHGSADTHDLIDMNGDGRPDCVRAPIGGQELQVWLNTGAGFAETPSRFQTPWVVLRFTDRNGLQIAGLADLNGDGLADQVLTWNRSGGLTYTGAWKVMINTGNRAVGPVDWKLPPSGCGWNGMRNALNDGRGDVVRDLFDINGDGLADVVEACRNGARSAIWRVWLNRGAGFQSQAFDWPAPRDAIRTVAERGMPQGAVTFYRGDVFDADADSIPDAVTFSPDRATITRNRSGAWCASADGSSCAEAGTLAARTEAVRSDLLVQMENGIGGTTYLDYEPSSVWDNTDSAGVWRLPWTHWTVSRITNTDGWCDNGGTTTCAAPYGAHETTVSMVYAYGLYEPEAREFRGFRTVARIESDGVRQYVFYHQDAARLGRPEATSLVDAQERLLRYEVESWECVPMNSEPCRFDPSNCAAVTCPQLLAPAERFWTRRREALRYDTENFMIRKVSGLRNLAWDAYGNVTRTQRFGSGTPAIETFTVFQHRDEWNRYLVDRAIDNWTLDHGRNRIVERVWTEYDARGNPTALYRWVDQLLPALAARFVACPGGGSCTRTRMTYDAFGNVTATEDTEGRRTEQFYDEDTRTHIVRTINPLGHQTTQLFHPSCGTKLEESIPHKPEDWRFQNVPSNRWQYDSFCRLRAQFRTMDPPERPYMRFRHALGGNGQPSVVVVDQLVSGPRRTTRYHLFDAFGRAVQTQRESYVDGRRSTIIEGTKFYDERGRLTVEFAPFTVRRSRGSYVAPPLVYGVATFEYDALGRITQRTGPDGAVTRFEYNEAWTKETSDPCTNAGTCAGARTRERQDAFGRVVEKTSSSGTRFLQATASQYDAFGRVIETVQASAPAVWDGSTATRFTYDSRGLLVRREDPNSGVWEYGYDPAGNLVYVNDPTPGRHTSLCYDAVGRLVAKFYSSGDAYRDRCSERNPDVRYQYDRPVWVSDVFPGEDPRGAVSRLTAVYEATGANLTYYDAHGRPVANRVTLELPGEGATRATMLWSYDPAGNVSSMTYPDGERVRYRYDPAGQVYGVIGNKVYARRITYDMFSRPRELFFGNGTRDIREYAGSGNHFRLASSRTERSGQVLQRVDYAAYTANGLLRSVNDTVAPGVPDLNRTASFTYDGLARLTSVQLPASSATLRYDYDALGNLVQKEGSTLFYDGPRPHQVTAVDEPEHVVQYDANGNRIRRGARTFEYDAENRLVRVDSGSVEFAYDQAGNRIGTRRNGGLWTRSYFGLVEAGDGRLTKYYFAGKILLASQTVPDTTLAYSRDSSWLRVVAMRSAGGIPVLHLALRRDAAPLAGLGLFALLACLWIVPGRSRATSLGRLHRGRVLLLVLVFLAGSSPWPWLVRPAHAAPFGAEFTYYHLNHVGSTEMITSERGAVIAHIRFAPFGGLLGYFNAQGERLVGVGCEEVRACRDFTGYQRDAASGLHYAGARFYDSDIAMFQTHDPAHQFANPYTYAAWNPTNLTDANGEFVEILIAIVVGAVLAASISVMAAAAQGLPLSQIGKAAIAGAIAGAVGVGLGIVTAAITTGIASIAGTLPSNVAVGDAFMAIRNTAFRSMVTTLASHSTTETGRGLGLPDPLTSVASVAASVAAGKWYDGHFLQAGASGLLSEWGLIPTSTTAAHTDITRQAALDAGFNGAQAELLVQYNLAQDGWGQSPWREVWTLLNNEGHFDFAAQRNVDAALKGLAAGGNKLQALGAASHFLQDQYALGHIVPGTHFFRGIFGAPFRVVIHQLVGGEVSFVGPSRQATTELFRRYRDIVGTVST